MIGFVHFKTDRGEIIGVDPDLVSKVTPEASAGSRVHFGSGDTFVVLATVTEVIKHLSNGTPSTPSLGGDGDAPIEGT